MNDAVDHYIKTFEKLKKDLRQEPHWLTEMREGAVSDLSQKGYPALKDAAWHFTDITPIRETNWEIPAKYPSQKEINDQFAFFEEKYSKNIILFMGGHFAKENVSGSGVKVLPLSQAFREDSGFLEPCLNNFSGLSRDFFTDLNTSFMQNGVFIHIPGGQKVEEPIRLIFVASASGARALFQPRNLIVLGQKSEATVIETYEAKNDNVYFHNVVSQILLEENASLKHYKVQDEDPRSFHIASTYVLQKKASSFSSLSVSAGARIMRNNCRVFMLDEEAQCELKGLSFSKRDQLLDHQTFVDHQKPKGTSRQFFKGVFAGKSRGVFGGKVLVRKGAQQTNASQTTKNLVLSDQAKVDAQPELEILADDVKCSHGAAVGQLEEDAVFYLRSRGIGEKEANRILVRGFVQEGIEESIPSPVKNEIIGFVDAQLKEQIKHDEEKL